MSDIPVHGEVEPGFERVEEAFERSFDNGEMGAAVCAYVDGRKVVDVWGGWADVDRTREWQRDTIVNTYSATKGMTATCAHRLVDRGLLDVDEPVATYWPEFAQAGKDKIPVRMVLSHQAGLVLPTVPVPPDKRWDWRRLLPHSPKPRPRGSPARAANTTGGRSATSSAKSCDGSTGARSPRSSARRSGSPSVPTS
jgi:CubicO group peptidase (beta-lactamase class C family)